MARNRHAGHSRIYWYSSLDMLIGSLCECGSLYLIVLDKCRKSWVLVSDPGPLLGLAPKTGHATISTLFPEQCKWVFCPNSPSFLVSGHYLLVYWFFKKKCVLAPKLTPLDSTLGFSEWHIQFNKVAANCFQRDSTGLLTLPTHVKKLQVPLWYMPLFSLWCYLLNRIP